MSRYTPPRINEEFGGISPYLDKTADEHNKNDAAKLKELWNWGAKPHMSISALAMLFGVAWTTMDDWINRIHEEAGIPRPGKDLQAQAK